MRSFLLNLVLLIGLAVVLFALFPQTMRQVVGVYNGLGILPLFVLMLILAALPRRRRKRR